METLVSHDTLTVGDTLGVRLRVNAPQGADIYFTKLPADTLSAGLEYFSPPRIDTLLDNAKQGLTMQMHLVLSSYDSGLRVLPRIGAIVMFKGKVDSLYSTGQLIRYQLMQRDSVDSEAIRAVVPPLQPPFNWRLLLWWILGVLALAALITAIWIYVRRRRMGKSLFQRPEPTIPPDARALAILNELKEHQAWRSPGVKPFFVSMTDALRHFMGDVWPIRTLEETTGEIVKQLERLPQCNKEELTKIQRILELGDLVKFAKYQPNESECITSVDQSITLVKQISRELPKEPIVPEKREDESSVEPEAKTLKQSTDSSSDKSEKSKESSESTAERKEADHAE